MMMTACKVLGVIGCVALIAAALIGIWVGGQLGGKVAMSALVLMVPAWFAALAGKFD
jgi:hypothetical protein